MDKADEILSNINAGIVNGLIKAKLASRESDSSRHDRGYDECENINTQKVAIEAFDAVVSHAISPAISLNNGREKLKTETQSNKSGNQSRSYPAGKPDCYQCVYRGSLPYSAHSECNHPYALEPSNRLATPYFLLIGKRSPLMKLMNVSAHQHGIDSGWCMWPIDFDPVWIETCDRFKAKDEAENEPNN